MMLKAAPAFSQALHQYGEWNGLNNHLKANVLELKYGFIVLDTDNFHKVHRRQAHYCNVH